MNELKVNYYLLNIAGTLGSTSNLPQETGDFLELNIQTKAGSCCNGVLHASKAHTQCSRYYVTPVET